MGTRHPHKNGQRAARVPISGAWGVMSGAIPQLQSRVDATNHETAMVRTVVVAS